MPLTFLRKQLNSSVLSDIVRPSDLVGPCINYWKLRFDIKISCKSSWYSQKFKSVNPYFDFFEISD